MPDRAWIIAGVGRETRHGGQIRAHYVFRALAARTAAAQVEGVGVRSLGAALARRPRLVRARLAAARLLGPSALRLASRALRPAVLDFHDNPVLQPQILGLPMERADRDRLERAMRANLDAFEQLIVPSESAVALSGLDAARTVVVPNGTDSRLISEIPLPDEPVVAMVSGAAPGRGIESLVDAMRLVRDQLPDARLQLGLAASGPTSRRYLDALRQRITGEPGVTLDEVPFERLSAFLGRALVLAVPHPPGEYMDAATPVKLFDSMAAGRPVVVTPRFETARIVSDCRAGVVTASDRLEDLAYALLRLLGDRARVAELGRNARRAAVERYDWRVLSELAADHILGRSA